MPYSIAPLGDSALTVEFGDTISDEIHRKVLLLVRALEEAGLPDIKDIVPAYSSVSVFYDAIALLKRNHKGAFGFMSKQMEALLSQPIDMHVAGSRKVMVPVCYSRKYGLDLDAISEQTELPVEEIIHLHTAAKYKVYMIGFLPGFAYMGDVDERIAVPRRPEPRTRIEAGSVGIAGKQTGIYPLASPGGWQIIGRTPVILFDTKKETPVFFRAGEEVQFYPITEDEFNDY